MPTMIHTHVLDTFLHGAPNSSISTFYQIVKEIRTWNLFDISGTKISVTEFMSSSLRKKKGFLTFLKFTVCLAYQIYLTSTFHSLRLLIHIRNEISKREARVHINRKVQSSKFRRKDGMTYFLTIDSPNFAIGSRTINSKKFRRQTKQTTITEFYFHLRKISNFLKLLHPK